MEKQKKPRESTDLAEYIFLGTNNFSQLQIVKKLELCKDWQKTKIFSQKHAGSWDLPDRDSPDLTIVLVPKKPLRGGVKRSCLSVRDTPYEIF